MSEIYLTKIERKTIFTKALIFVLIMVIISDLTVTGPFWFNFVPWLYLLGTIGSLKKIDGALMGIIGTFNVFVSSALSEGGIYSTCVINSGVALVSLLLGTFTGKILYEFVLEHRLVKYIKRSKKTIYITYIIVMALAVFIIVGINNGNVVTYLKSKANIQKYISKTYSIQDYDIIKTKYNRYAPGKYTYIVRINEQDIYFFPVTEEIFVDSNKDTRYIQACHNLDVEIADKADKIVKKYANLAEAKIKYSIDYNEFGVNSTKIILNIKHETKNTDDKLYENISKLIKELQNIKQASRIVITINDEVAQFSINDLDKLNKDYIKGGFEIQEISE